MLAQKEGHFLVCGMAQVCANCCFGNLECEYPHICRGVHADNVWIVGHVQPTDPETIYLALARACLLDARPVVFDFLDSLFEDQPALVTFVRVFAVLGFTVSAEIDKLRTALVNYYIVHRHVLCGKRYGVLAQDEYYPSLRFIFGPVESIPPRGLLIRQWCDKTRASMDHGIVVELDVGN